MSPAVAKLVEASQALSLEDQLELFDALWEMVDVSDGAVEFELSPEQHAELDRRRKAAQQSPELLISWEEGRRLIEEIRAGL